MLDIHENICPKVKFTISKYKLKIQIFGHHENYENKSDNLENQFL